MNRGRRLPGRMRRLSQRPPQPKEEKHAAIATSNGEMTLVRTSNGINYLPNREGVHCSPYMLRLRFPNEVALYAGLSDLGADAGRSMPRRLPIELEQIKKPIAFGDRLLFALTRSLSLNIELLGMQCGVALDEDVLARELFEIVQPARIVRLEGLYGFRVHAE